tara:strand:+ start:3990 stop:4601 length:612 start_codon:yes stop_codon:yes gene_type:complete
MKSGFGQSLAPQDKVRNLLKNTRALQAHNIDDYVYRQRQSWNNNYGNRGRDLKYFSVDDLMKVPENSPNDPEYNRSLVINPNHSVTAMNFLASYGHWSLQIMSQDNRKTADWQLSLKTPVLSSWHPNEIENVIRSHHSEEVFRDYKRLVMSQFREATNSLINQARRDCRGLTAWSITSCDRSSLLVAQMPRVSVSSGVAFLTL